MDKMEEIFDRLGINAKFKEGGEFNEKLALFGYSMKNCKIDVQFHYADDGDKLIIFALPTDRTEAPEDKRFELTLLANEFNRTPSPANMLTDPYVDGSYWVKFRNYYVENPTDKHVRDWIVHSIQSLDFIYPAIMKVIHADMSAKDAFQSLFDEDLKKIYHHDSTNPMYG